MTRKRNILLSSVLCIWCCLASGQSATSPAAPVLEKARNLENGLFRNCFFGAAAMYEDGEPILEINGRRMMMPASNMKVITTASALETLGADFRWETDLAWTGDIDADGTLKGDLYIIGKGDPTTGAGNIAGTGVDETFSRWKSLLLKAGIKRIDGGIIGDGSWLDGMREDGTWFLMDLGTYYGTCLSGLNFYENMKDFKVHAGAKEGDSLTIVPDFPDTPWMKWEYGCSTGAKGSGDQLFLYPKPEGNCGVIRGTFAAGLADKTIHCRNERPELSLAIEFSKWLNTNGFYVSGKACALFPGDGGMASIPEPVMKTGCLKCLSPTVAEVVRVTNSKSDNFYAEMLFRTMGSVLCGHSDSESGREAVSKAIGMIMGDGCASSARNGREIAIRDGSGLSTTNLVSPVFMCNFLRAVAGRPYSKTFLSSLVRYTDRVFLKTGTIGGCRNLCGYILPSAEGERGIVFSIMVNNSTLPTSTIDKAEKEIINLLSNM